MPFSPSYVNFVFGEGVSEDHEHAVRLGVELMHDYSLSLGRPDLDHKIHVYAFDNFDRMVDAVYEAWMDSDPYLTRDFVREYLGHGRFFGTAVRNYALINTSMFGDSDWDRINVIHTSAHEFNHAQCNNLGTLGLEDAYSQSLDIEPHWLGEGIAEFLALQGLSESGIRPCGDYRETYFFPGVFDVGPLEQMETREGFRAESYRYGYATLAVELLASFKGQSSLLGFYADFTLGISWEDQFEKTFGMRPDQFYSRIEEHKADGFPRLETPKFVE